MKKNILLLLLLCVAGMTNAFAYSFSSVCATGQTLYYNITDYTHHYVAITYPGTSGSYWNGYTKPSGNITLPVSVYYNGFTYTVKAIGNHAFHDCSDLTGNLSIPNTVTTIGDYAFYLCDFTGSLTIGNSVTSIGNYAFFGCCDFTGALTIPNSVTTIGDYAFYDCCRFTGTLTLGNSLTTIGERAFGTCSLASYNNTTGFTGSLTIPNSVTTIGNRAFEGCFSFSGSLTIGNSVTSIGHEAFIDCTGFTGSLTISNSVTSIGYGAFDNCTGFTQVYFNATNCADVSTTDEPFRICGGTLNIGSNVQRIPAHIFHGSSFTHLNYNATNCANPSPSAVPFADLGGTLTIGSTVQRIPTYMFCNCTGFTGSLTIPNSVTTIDSYAFKDCTGFTGSLNIGNSVTTIGGYAFYGCTGFTGSLTIPNSVTTIGNSAFKNCSSFTQVKFNAVNCADVTSGAKPFEGCGGTLTIGSTVQRIPAYMFYDCTGFTGSLTIPSSVLTIGNYAFYGNNFTGPLTILGNSMTSIGNYAFYECCLLTGTLTIPNSVTTIGDYAFYDCCRFTGTLTLGNSLTTIGEKAFYSCSLGGYNTTGFTGSLTIPNSVTSIGNSAFEGCFTFSGSLTIPNSVATIGTKAFKGCTGFTLMKVYPETPPTLGTNAFENVPTNIPVYVPCGSLEDYQAANGWNEFTNLQCLPETLTVYEGGTTASSSIPVWGTYANEYQKCQFIIPAEQLQDMARSTISGMTFYLSSRATEAWTATFYVEMTEVDNSYFSSNHFISDVYQLGYIVYHGTLDATGSTMDINFSTPYPYGNGNLLVSFRVTTPGNSNYASFIGETVANTASLYAHSSTTTSNNITTGTQSTFLPKTTFSFTLGNCARPIHLAVDNITNHTAELSWTGAQSSYNMRYRTAADTCSVNFLDQNYVEVGEWITLEDVTSPQTISGLSLGTKYEWQVQGVNSTCYGGLTEWSSMATFNTDVCDPDDKCELTFELTDSFGDSWNGAYIEVVDGETCAVVGTVTNENLNGTQGWGENEVNIKTLSVCDGRELWFVWHSGVYDGECSYTVYGADGEPIFSGSGAMSGPFDYTVDCNFGDCRKPSDLTAVSIAPDGVYLEWTEKGASESWYVFNLDNGEYAEVYSTYFSSWDYFETELEPSTEYTFAVAPSCAVTEGVPESSLTSTITFTTLEACPVPFNLSAEPIGGGAKLRWTGYSDSYNVRYRQVGETGWTTTTSGYWLELNYLESITTYEFQVQGVCDGATTDWSETATFTTLMLRQTVDDGDWNVAANWDPVGVPTIEEDVIVYHNMTIPSGVVAEANKMSGFLGYLIIEDGGQLVHNSNGSNPPIINMEKNITGYGSGNGHWYLITNPSSWSSLNPESCDLTSGNYDLYKFDYKGSDKKEWRNYKTATFSLDTYNSGYLYAHGTNILLELPINNYRPSNDRRSKYLSYTTGDYEFPGWYLIGNPFLCNAYLVNSSGAALPYYRMNTAGTDLEAVTSGAIAPLEGVFHKVTSSGYVYFTREAPARGSSLIIVVSGISSVDNAIISFSESTGLEKFNFREGGSKLYISQGGKDYAVAKAESNSGEMPVSFKAEQDGTYTLSFSSEEVTFSYLHLIDNITGEDIDLLTLTPEAVIAGEDQLSPMPSYTFNAKTTDNANRFKVVFITSNSK